MTKNVKFSVGDIVCYRESEIINTVPYIVESVVPDEDADNRIGEFGGSNSYRIRITTNLRPDLRTTITVYQSEIMFWINRRNTVIDYLKTYIQQIESNAK